MEFVSRIPRELRFLVKTFVKPHASFFLPEEVDTCASGVGEGGV